MQRVSRSINASVNSAGISSRVENERVSDQRPNDNGAYFRLRCLEDVHKDVFSAELFYGQQINKQLFLTHLWSLTAEDTRDEGLASRRQKKSGKLRACDRGVIRRTRLA